MAKWRRGKEKIVVLPKGLPGASPLKAEETTASPKPWGAMEGFAILIAFYLVGDLFHRLGVPLPGSVLGLIALTTALLLGWIGLHQVEAGARMLLKNLLLFFVPAIVGVLGYTTLFKEHGIGIITVWVGTLLIVLITTALTATAVSRLVRPHAE
jgi:holin-like protein